MSGRLLAGVALLIVLAVLAGAGVVLWLRSDAIRQTLERQATAAFAAPVRINSARPSVFPRLGVELRNVTVGDPRRASLDRVSLATGWSVIWSGRVEGADVRVAGGYIDASLLAALGGAAAVPSRSSSTRTGGQVPLSVVSIRSFRLRDVALGTGAERIPVSLDAALTGDRLTLSSAVVRVTGATLHAAGELSIARREGDFTVRSDVLPVAAVLGALKGLAPPQAASRSGSQEPRPAPYRLTVQITSPVAIIGAHRAESFEARLDASPAGIVVDPVTFGLAGGRFEARVTLDASQPVASVDYRGRLSGFDVARLQQATGARKAALAGRLDAAFALEAPLGAEMAALLDEARGTVSIDIRDGRMPGIEVVRRAVIRFANRAEPAPQVDASDAFSQLQASLTLRPGPARITRLTMRAEDFDLAGDGTLAPTDWAIALAANVTLTEALSQQAGRDLYRYAREGRRIVLPVIVGGTLFEPTASIDVGSAAGRALRNRIEEEARSLLERVMKRRQPNPSKP